MVTIRPKEATAHITTLKVMYRQSYYITRHKNYDTLGLRSVYCVSLTILELTGYRAVLYAVGRF